MDDNQLEVPTSFSHLYATPSGRLSIARAELHDRYELCEDLSQMLTEKASEMLHRLGVAESDVVERIQRGLEGEGSPVTPLEARWVVCRLAELLGWEFPAELSIEPPSEGQ
jgi:hypothetical protein